MPRAPGSPSSSRSDSLSSSRRSVRLTEDEMGYLLLSLLAWGSRMKGAGVQEVAEVWRKLQSISASRSDQEYTIVRTKKRKR